MRALRLFLPLFLAVGTACAPARTAEAQGSGPRLVMVISIDQFRPDYLTRFADHYLPARSAKGVGGFRYLMEQVAWFADARYTHIPTSTGPGHATILTGCGPALNGIVGNDWYDHASGKRVYCVDDPTVRSVGGVYRAVGSHNLKVTTVGDELKMATGGRAKVVSVAFKDRAAILLAGHSADTVIWWGGAGDWVTNDKYANGSALPAWVAAMNAKDRPESELSESWRPLLDAKAYAGTQPAPFVKGSGFPFDYPFKDKDARSTMVNWTSSGHGQQYVIDTVKLAIEKESLGVDDVPDLLAFNLSTNDYVGHEFGPNSPEVMDISVRTDRLLSDLFNTIDKKVGLKNVAIALTADHSVMPIAEEMAGRYRIAPAKRIPPKTLQTAVEEALNKEFSQGEGKWLVAVAEGNFYLNRRLAAEKGVAMNDLERVAARALMKVEGVQAAFTRTQILEGRMPSWPWAETVSRSYHPALGGDVVYLESPGVYFGDGTGTGHGSAWIYDSKVPMLLAGYGVRGGRYSRQVAVNDLAPTLADILGITPPSGSVGEILREAREQK